MIGPPPASVEWFGTAFIRREPACHGRPTLRRPRGQSTIAMLNELIVFHNATRRPSLKYRPPKYSTAAHIVFGVRSHCERFRIAVSAEIIR
jgi:hypothetical protein